ncbi:hypothetical protein EDD59_109128 [Muricomes intestini]|jgi:hypothetical protein|uniref:Uncharacterized protein n=1 Tax=Muricomes intestini TaxID=1796634 RepID=A0A4R3K8R1_9FIRM|nr:hypothetical protein [Muricomes intestini]TCS79193.1 hypothetical protein EDD59_109128 [Muricomes intestini]
MADLKKQLEEAKTESINNKFKGFVDILDGYGEMTDEQEQAATNVLLQLMLLERLDRIAEALEDKGRTGIQHREK